MLTVQFNNGGTPVIRDWFTRRHHSSEYDPALKGLSSRWMFSIFQAHSFLKLSRTGNERVNFLLESHLTPLCRPLRCVLGWLSAARPDQSISHSLWTFHLHIKAETSVNTDSASICLWLQRTTVYSNAAPPRPPTDLNVFTIVQTRANIYTPYTVYIIYIYIYIYTVYTYIDI